MLGSLPARVPEKLPADGRKRACIADPDTSGSQWHSGCYLYKRCNGSKAGNNDEQQGIGFRNLLRVRPASSDLQEQQPPAALGIMIRILEGAVEILRVVSRPHGHR